MAELPKTCPHCGTALKKWQVPVESSWSEEYFYVCFDDDCSHYRKGWEWMKEQFRQRASYRYMLSPDTGASSSLPVWSESAMRELIVDPDEGNDDQ